MLTEFCLNNFKAIATTQQIPLKPITLVYGANSSGKSSILQALMMLKQTLEDSENPDTLLLPKGNLVDLGGYREFINGHDVSKSFSFQVRFKMTGRGIPPSFMAYRAISASKIPTFGFRLTLRFDEKIGGAALDELKLLIGDSEEPAMTFKPVKFDIEKHKRAFIQFSAGGPSRTGENCLVCKTVNRNHPFWAVMCQTMADELRREALPEINRRREYYQKRLDKLRNKLSHGIPEEGKAPDVADLEKRVAEFAQAESQLKGFGFEAAMTDLEAEAKSIFLGCRNFLPVALWQTEERAWRRKGMPWEFVPHHLFFELGNLPSIALFVCSEFLSCLNNVLYIGPLRDYPERHYIYSGNLTDQVGKSGKMVPDVLFKRRDLVQLVNETLDGFGLNYELKVSSVGDPNSDLQDVFALRLLDKSTNIHASILDVGFGISQVLPILVQAMLSNNKLLSIEQPEIHLHPKLQADLASLFAKCIKPPFENHFLIETHSQHIVLRLQKLIRNKQLSPDDVCVVYVDRTQDGAKCLQLRLDRDGDFIDEWPHGFFEEGYREMFS